ncbi:hypothetical protein LTR37_012803 [Vermiconidia calcicola]|uniref:Uncharacterized protein n=1 Tax=Vermiconidia calcicola TaxID=1690605 RepID=A0ACC3MY92_9PEZI|nr:hypothetical protein LTR37_012803 [Vermiconidia calcicola]
MASIPPELGNRHDDDDFRQPILTDASREIRLLRFDRMYQHKYDLIVADMTVFNLEDAPPYGAISYTWGSPERSMSIEINGKMTHVSVGCWYALFQVRYRCRDDFDWSYAPEDFWIDALCIDQSNLDEKSHQVALMTEIYSRAERVLACTGYGDLLFDFFDSLSQGLSAMWVGTSDPCIHLSKRFARFLRADASADRVEDLVSDGMSIEREGEGSGLHVIRLIDTLYEFAQREYFYRKWIQEILLKDTVVILCSERAASLEILKIYEIFLSGALRLLPRAIGREVEPVDRIHQLNECTLMMVVKTMDRSPFKSMQLHDAIRTFIAFECTHPLDQVYALQAFIVPNAQGRHIIPDYTKTTLDLAVQVLGQVESWSWKYLMVDLLPMLRPNSSRASKRLRKKIRGRHRLNSAALRLPTYYDLNPGHAYARAMPSASDDESSATLAIDRTRVSPFSGSWSKIRVDSEGFFTAQLHRMTDDQLSYECNMFSDGKPCQMSYFDESLHPENWAFPRAVDAPEVLWTDTLEAALVPEATRPGDLILQIDTWSPRGTKGLVLRHHLHDIYEIIGHALVNPYFSLCSGGSECPHAEVRSDSSNTTQISQSLRFEVFLDKTDYLLSTVILPDSHFALPYLDKKLPTGLRRQRFSSFAVSYPAYFTEKQKRRYTSNVNLNVSPFEMERGKGIAGPIRDRAGKGNGLRRVASVG